jgi:hypothetical protein
MVKLITNFNKEDCRHFKWTFSQACCGRGTSKAGACTIRLPNEGEVLVVPNKVCSLSMHYCEYEKREEEI